MKTHIYLKSVEGSKENKIIQLRRNGDWQLTKIQAHRELFSYANRINREPKLSIFLLYDLNTGLFLWQLTDKVDDESDFQGDIKTRLNQLGYYKEDNGVYTHYNDTKKSKSFRQLFADKRVIFSCLSRMSSLHIKEDKEQHKSFEQAYNGFIVKIKNQTDMGLAFERKKIKIIPLIHYIDARFFNIPGCCTRVPVVEISNVKWLNYQWFIELAGVDWESAKVKKICTIKDWLAQWQEGINKTKVTIVLNENYEVVDLFGENFLKQSNPLYLSFNHKLQERDEIIELMHSGYTVQEISDSLRKDNKTISQLINKMLEEGLVEKIGYGKYKSIAK